VVEHPSHYVSETVANRDRKDREAMADDENLENVPDELEEELDDLSESLRHEHDDSPAEPPPPPD
jgi:hypothetical protein